jgi:ParB family chromosome partitioning protein
MIPLNNLVTSPLKLRQTIDDALISELAETIGDKGLIETLIARRLPSRRYQIVVGEQRYLAAQKAELTEIPCIVKKLNDREASETSLIENNQRKTSPTTSELGSTENFLRS